MSTSHIVGDVRHINRPAEQVFTFFQDFSLFGAMLPEDKKSQVSFTKDTILTKMQGMELGIEVVERVPYTLISCKQYGNSPMAFNANIHINPLIEGCEFSLEFEADLPIFLKPMLEPKVKEFVQQFSEQLANAMNKA